VVKWSSGQVVKCQVVSAQAKRVEVMISPYIHIRICPLPQPCIHASRHSSHGVRVILVLLACRVPTNRAQFLCKEQPLNDPRRPRIANAGDGGVCRV
jgi:hypothetical protein